VNVFIQHATDLVQHLDHTKVPSRPFTFSF